MAKVAPASFAEILNFPRTEALRIPRLGFGTYQIPPGRETEAAVSVALKEGYRHIDTASLYGNEQAVGEAGRQLRPCIGSLLCRRSV